MALVSDQLLLNKQRHCFLCNKTAGAKSQQVTSEGITSKCDKDTNWFYFRDLLAGVKFSITKLFHEEQQRKAGKATKFIQFTRRRHEVRVNPPQFGKFSGDKTRRKVAYPNFASFSKVQK